MMREILSHLIFHHCHLQTQLDKEAISTVWRKQKQIILTLLTQAETIASLYHMSVFPHCTKATLH